MTYVVWRLQRNQVYVAGGALVALAVVLLIGKGQLGKDAVTVLVYATIVVPVLFGLFWGAPLLAKEFEDGTHSLVWTQGVTRRRWLRSNVTGVLLIAVVWSAALTALITWWSLPEISLQLARSSPGPFDIQGIAPVAYSVFAVALGIAAGAMIRRVLPAMATTPAVFVAVRVVIAVLVRSHYMSPVSRLVSLAQAQGLRPAPAGSWLLVSLPPYIGPNGHNYGTAVSPMEAPVACRPNVTQSCLTSHGFHQLITYQPASRFWAFQGIEAAIFIVLAAGLVALACRMVLTRDA